MGKKKTVGIPVAIITIIAGIAGGSYAFDLSSTVNTITNTNVDQSGDETTNIFQDITGDIGEDAFMASQCYKNEIPEEYSKACKEWLESP